MLVHGGMKEFVLFLQGFVVPVSYTHLDVYKRQRHHLSFRTDDQD